MVDIAALEASGKKREDPLSNKEKQPVPENEAVIADKLEGAKVQRRKRTRNGEMKKIVSQLEV